MVPTRTKRNDADKSGAQACCDFHTQHLHCSCGAVLEPFPTGPVTDESIYALNNRERLDFRWGLPTCHQILDGRGRVLFEGVHPAPGSPQLAQLIGIFRTSLLSPL